jgi:predicted peptidase
MIKYCTHICEAKQSSPIKYILTFPTGYSKDEKLPLIIFLHGAGERGNDIEKIKCYCIPKLFTENPDYNSERVVTLSPLCPQDSTWIDFKYELYTLFCNVIDGYNIDKKRVSLCGISMGGFGTWEMAMSYPEMFNKIAPLCGGGMNWRANYLKDIKIRVYHGRKDDVVPLCQSEAMVNSAKNAGACVEFTIYDDLWHNCWDRAFYETDLIHWLSIE